MTRSPEHQPTVLVTGAGGFVGGHVARHLAASGYRVRGLTRRTPQPEPGDPPIDWLQGDLLRPEDRRRAVEGTWAVIHVASWVSLGADRAGQAEAVNVAATTHLLDQAEASGVARFVYTSTLWTVAAGTPEAPANEDAPWNLQVIDSPYSRTKREAERRVLDRAGPRLHTSALCLSMVIGPRDVRPTSTRMLLAMARAPVVVVPAGGLPMVDAGVAALAHQRALERAEPGRRYVVAGPYLSYPDLARLVARLTGRPHLVLTLPHRFERPLVATARRLERWTGGRFHDLSPATVAGAFLRLHLSGARADAAFDLRHPPPIQSIHDALADAHASGRAPWLRISKVC